MFRSCKKWFLDSGLDIVYYLHLYVTFNFKQGDLQKNIFSLDSDPKPLYYLISYNVWINCLQ